MYTKDDLRDLTLVEGCATDHGYWMRATGPGADQISGHRIGSRIASRFDERRVARFFDEHPEGRLPEYYMLVDDPAAPTIAHVSLGAAGTSPTSSSRRRRIGSTSATSWSISSCDPRGR